MGFSGQEIVAILVALFGGGGVGAFLKHWMASRQENLGLAFSELKNVVVQFRKDAVAARDEAIVARAEHRECMELHAQTQREIGALQGAMGRLNAMNQVAVVLSDTDGKIVSWNEGALLIFQYSESEALGRDVDIVIPKRFQADHHVAFKEKVKAIQAGIKGNDKVIETRQSFAVRKDGSEFPATIHLSHYTVKGHTLLSAEIRQR